MGNVDSNEVLSLKIEHLTETVKELVNKIDKQAKDYKEFQLATSNSITELKTKMLIYVAVGSFIISGILSIAMKKLF